MHMPCRFSCSALVACHPTTVTLHRWRRKSGQPGSRGRLAAVLGQPDAALRVLFVRLFTDVRFVLSAAAA